MAKDVCKKLSDLSKVCPVTAKHVIDKQTDGQQNKSIAYLKFGFKPKICVLGLNPHNYELLSDSEEKRIILPAIKKLIKKGINVKGPVPADTAFINSKSYDILIGMYHDQVLGPYKTIFNFNAINITAGLPYLRVSPDHGTGKDIVKKNLANPLSLIESIKFFKSINV